MTLALLGCRGADPGRDLVLVRRAVEHEPGAPPRFVLVARSEVVAAPGEVVMWLPLPASDEFQSVSSLAVEVGPRGALALEEAGGDRVLRVGCGEAATVNVRAVIDRLDPGARALPPALDDLAPGLEPTAWAAAASARGVEARVVHGLELTSDGQTLERRWPEVLIDGAWSPVDAGRIQLPPRRVRLAARPPRATADGQPAELRTAYALEER
ncbi:MAG: hypothetical protein M9894_30835 [Planctomycetes bacterium]|nr:hypothetical protein [Planctomycetota bacterium]